MLAYTGPAAALGPAETFFRALQDTPRAGGKVAAMLFSRQFLGFVAGDAEAPVDTLRMVSEPWFPAAVSFFFFSSHAVCATSRRERECSHAFFLRPSRVVLGIFC